MRVLVTGSTGLIGERVVARLRARGDEVTPLVRGEGREGIRWDPPRGEVGDVSGFDAVVHLAGENLARGRWTEAKKRRIRDSRVAATRLLTERLAQCGAPPRVLVCASAVGIYGDRGDEELTRASAPGTGFLAELTRDWEEAAQPARAAGIRVVHPRFGLVLARHGGALANMLLPFKLGLGGVIGDGKQWWSWIALDDAARVVLFALDDHALHGPLNAVAQPVTNREFTKKLGRVLHRPTVMRVPRFALRVALGEMADALLASTRAVPQRLNAIGFALEQKEIEGALRAALAG